MAAPLHLLGAKPYKCGCGRTWGCVELYTTLAGLPYLLEERLANYPHHPLAHSKDTPKKKALARSVGLWARAVYLCEIIDFHNGAQVRTRSPGAPSRLSSAEFRRRKWSFAAGLSFF